MTLALLQLQVSHGAVPSSPVDLILDATPVTQGVLIILVFLSLLSWSIMFGVWRSLKKAARSADKFWAEFEHVSRLEDAATLAKKSKPSALPRLFMRAVRFVADARVANQQVLERATTPSGGDTPTAATLSGSQIETLHLLLDADASDERDRLGRFLPWLATDRLREPAHRAPGYGARRDRGVSGNRVERVGQPFGRGARRG